MADSYIVYHTIPQCRSCHFAWFEMDVSEGVEHCLIDFFAWSIASGFGTDWLRSDALRCFDLVFEDDTLLSRLFMSGKDFVSNEGGVFLMRSERRDACDPRLGRMFGDFVKLMWRLSGSSNDGCGSKTWRMETSDSNDALKVIADMWVCVLLIFVDEVYTSIVAK